MTATLSTTAPPLDEQVFSSPGLLQSWGSSAPTSNNIHFYFAHSPFFDRTSNNATILNQAQFNPELGAIVATRVSFEAHLRSMAGVEFVVAHDPTPQPAGPGPGPGRGFPASNINANANGAAAGVVTGPWTIRKQIRRKGTGPKGEDSVEALADYFVVGDCIFQAPTLGAILGTRLLATAKALITLVDKAGKCVGFEPARGHVYPNPAAAAKKGLLGSASAAASAFGSRGTTPMLEMSGTDDQNPTTDDDDYDARHDAALLAETFMNFSRYGKEYMDEHPLVGEPGNFIIQKNKELQVPIGLALAERKGLSLPSLTLKTDLASAVNKREKGGEKSPLSPTGTGATKKKKKDKSKAQTPKEPKTPAA